MLSKACEYGIRATIYVARQSLKGRRSNLKEISAAIQSPEAFTAKILQQLVRNSIIISTKGVKGGFETDIETIHTLPVSRIINAIDGDAIFNRCVLGLRECSDKNPCPLHYKYKVIRKEIANMTDGTLLINLVRGLKTTVLRT